MSHSKNKLNWCLKKAEKELKDSGKIERIGSDKTGRWKIIPTVHIK